MTPRILRAAGAARALAGDLGLPAELWETGEGATVTATVQIGGGLAVAETLSFDIEAGALVTRARLQAPVGAIADLVVLDAFHRAVSGLTCWACAGQRLARRVA